MVVSNRHSKIDNMVYAVLAKTRLPIVKRYRSAARASHLLAHTMEQMTLGLGQQWQ